MVRHQLFLNILYVWKELSRYIAPLQELYELQPRVRTVCLCTCDLVIGSCDVKHRGSLVMMLWGCVWELWEWQVKSHTSDISHRSREVNSWALSFHKLCLNAHCLHRQITAAQFTKSCEQNWELSEALPPGKLAKYLMNMILNIEHYLHDSVTTHSKDFWWYLMMLKIHKLKAVKKYLYVIMMYIYIYINPTVWCQ